MPDQQTDFSALVRAHHAAVHRSAARCSDAETARDVTQEVFLRVLEGKVRFGAGADERAVLCWLATRLAANARRAQQRRRRREEQSMTINDRVDPDPAEACQTADVRAALQQHVAALPLDLRLPLLMRCEDSLGYAEIGTALRIGESTAHERVQRALARLRAALQRVGLAAVVVDVERLLGAEPAVAPAGLEAACLQLAPRVGLFGGVSMKVGALLLGLSVAGWVAVRASDAWQAPPSSHLVAATAPLAVRDDPSVALPASELAVAALRQPVELAPTQPLDQDPAKAPVVVTGTVHDAGAWPVANARVVAVASGGLKPFELATTTVDAAGAFRLEVGGGRHNLGASVVRLRVFEGQQLLLESADVPLRGDGAGAPVVLVLPASLGLATERFLLRIEVTDAAGGVIEGADVQLFAADQERPLGGGAAEQRGASDASGAVQLEGRTLGDKWLFVDGRKRGCGTSCTKIERLGSGERSLRIALQPGRSWRGSVRGVDGEALQNVSLWVVDAASGLQTSASVAADGAALFTGLDAGPYTLHCWAQDRSPAVRRAVAPGEPFQLRLKRRDDEVARGDHEAELHGELFDAATGDDLQFSPFAVDTFAVRAGESTLLFDRLVPNAPVQRAAEDRLYSRFHEVGLAPGSHALVARVDGYAPSVVLHTLAAGEVQVVRVPMQRGGIVKGVVTAADGAPFAGAMVYVVGVGALADEHVETWRAASQQPRAGGRVSVVPAGWARAGKDGAFAMHHVPPGVSLRFVAVHAGAVAVTPPFMVSPGETLEHIELRLRAQ